MAVTINDYLELVLKKYEEKMGTSRFKAITGLGLSFARYYAYRFGYGNPTGKMLDRIHTSMYESCPGIAIETILENLDEEHLMLVIEKIAEYFTAEHFKMLMELREKYDDQHALAVSNYPGNDE